MQLWTPEYELEYWAGIDPKEYIAGLTRKYKRFNIDLPDNPELVVDVGGGKFGGALHLYRAGQRRVMVDLLADDFNVHGIECINSDFTNLPFDDKSVDVLFTWEVYDHADDEQHFWEGIDEALRVLKGTWLFQHRLRPQPIIGHPTTISVGPIAKRIRPVWEHATSGEYFAIVQK